MKKYFIELTKSSGNVVAVLDRYETSTDEQAFTIFDKLIKKARAEKSGDGARILYGRNYDDSDIVEIWGRW